VLSGIYEYNIQTMISAYRLLTPVVGLMMLVSYTTATPAPIEQQLTMGLKQIEQPYRTGKLQILSVLKLETAEFNGLEMVELSGLAWSDDDQTLYAISDHGVVFHLKPVFEDGILAGVRLQDAHALKGEGGSALSGPYHDSEGVFVVNDRNRVTGDDELIISYERRPRIQRHDARGMWKGNIDLPPYLEDVNHYRGSNSALESVTLHPDHGVLTIPQDPLDNALPNTLVIYSASGRQWVMPRSEDEGLSVVAIETMPDGKLLLMQRRHRTFGTRWKIVLGRLTLHDDGHAVSERLAEITSDQEEFHVDNFEGLARHSGNRYFMISDDNEHALQDTLLVYFEIID